MNNDVTGRPRDDYLLILDCDGVLVDSELISCRVHAELLTQYGYQITADSVRERFLGRSARDANRDIEIELGRPLPAEFDRRRKIELLDALAREVVAVPYVHEAIDAISMAKCVASSGAQEKIYTTLSKAGLYQRLAPNIFSASQVANGKPAPDLFLFAAKQMKVQPQCCVVIEDSVAGVTAACAAGMPVIGFVGGSHCQKNDDARLSAAGAMTVIEDMRRLPGIIEKHFAEGCLNGA